MQEITEYFKTNPIHLLIAIIVCFAFLYFFYRKIISALVVFLVLFLLTFLGYFYYRDTNSLMGAFNKTKMDAQKIYERSANIFDNLGEKTLDVGKEIKERIEE